MNTFITYTLPVGSTSTPTSTSASRRGRDGNSRATEIAARTFTPIWDHQAVFPVNITDALVEYLKTGDIEFHLWHVEPRSEKVLIGVTSISLNELLERSQGIRGWFPVLSPSSTALKKPIGYLNLCINFNHAEEIALDASRASKNTKTKLKVADQRHNNTNNNNNNSSSNASPMKEIRMRPIAGRATVVVDELILDAGIMNTPVGINSSVSRSARSSRGDSTLLDHTLLHTTYWIKHYELGDLRNKYNDDDRESVSIVKISSRKKSSR